MSTSTPTTAERAAQVRKLLDLATDLATELDEDVSTIDDDDLNDLATDLATNTYELFLLAANLTARIEAIER